MAEQRAGLALGVNSQGLRYAERDAFLCKLALDKLGYAVTPLTGAAATLQAVTAELRRFQARPVFDRFVFFFSGHAYSTASGGHLLHLHPGDADDPALITTHDLTDLIGRLVPARSVVLAIDACRRYNLPPLLTRRAVPLWTEVDLQKFQHGAEASVYTLLSCGPGQASWEHEEIQHGIFSYAFCNALERYGDSLSIEALHLKIGETVLALCDRFRLPVQRPQAFLPFLPEPFLLGNGSRFEPTTIDRVLLDKQKTAAEQGPSFKYVAASDLSSPGADSAFDTHRSAIAQRFEASNFARFILQRPDDSMHLPPGVRQVEIWIPLRGREARSVEIHFEKHHLASPPFRIEAGELGS